MSFSVRCLPAVLLLLLSLPASLSAQSTTKQTSKAPRGSISGRVTIKEKPAAGVVVVLRKSDMAMPFEPYQRATTDQDGAYRITNVAPGNYEVSPAAPAFVVADTKETRGKTVLVGEDENVESINFALVRGGVITGRIADAEGRPVIQQQVTIYRAEAFDQQTQPRPAFPTNTVPTDDRGIYRVYGLSPGRYKVAAGKAEDGFSGVYGSNRATYKQVFHPDVTDQSKATVIEVSEGSEAQNIDITLGRALQTFSASGRAIDAEKGSPVPNLRFALQRSLGQRTEFVNTITTSNNQGDFVFEGLTPGKYGFYLLPTQGNGMRAEALSFDVIDQDVSGLTVRLVKGASVSGVVILETEDKTVLQMLPQLQLRAFVMVPSGGAGFGSSNSSPIAPDGSFNLTALPGGTVNFNLGLASGGPFPPKGLTISRVERDGVSSSRLEIRDGEQVTGVRVIVSYGTATLRGVVKAENGTLPEGARFFVRLNKAGESGMPNPMAMRPPQVDARGRFLIEGIPAGTYELTANLMITTPTPAPFARPAKKEVTVQDGVTTDVTITIDLSTPPKP
ncbi:MAG TPA: carboxypeptidase regulatory-like domain-containing protein [Pyrinomonadaceae bacterium]